MPRRRVHRPPSSSSSPTPPTSPTLRIRERALGLGVEQLDDRELLDLVLIDHDDHDDHDDHGDRGDRGDDSVDVERLLHEATSLHGLAAHGVGSLVEELGLGLTRAARLAAAIELGLRVGRTRHELRRETIGSAREVERWGRARLMHLPHEELWALLVDGRNRIIAERQLARGGVHGCAVTARDVLRPVLREAASAFVLVHNHPSGDPCPSREDLALTRKVSAAAELVGTPLLDHVIVADQGHVSLLESGLLDELHDGPEDERE